MKMELYYRDNELNLYKIIDEMQDLYICEGIKGKYCGNIVNFHKRTGKRSWTNDNSAQNIRI